MSDKPPGLSFAPLVFQLLVFLLALSALAGQPGSGDVGPDVVIRGKGLRLYHFSPASDSSSQHNKVLLVSGDGGWKGFEKKMARAMAAWGYDVYGLNSRQYLKAFSELTVANVESDFGAMTDFLSRGPGDTVTLMGWSEGAALVVAAGASNDNKKKLAGVVAVSLPESGILSWHWVDHFAFLPLLRQKGPFFSTVPYVPKVAPLPLVILQSSHDKYVTAEDTDKLFSVAISPRRRIFLHAGGHSFAGNRKAFFQELHSGLEWVRSTREEEVEPLRKSVKFNLLPEQDLQIHGPH